MTVITCIHCSLAYLPQNDSPIFLLVSPEYNQNFAGVEYEDLEEPEKDEQAIDFLIGKTFDIYSSLVNFDISLIQLHVNVTSYFDYYEYVF